MAPPYGATVPAVRHLVLDVAAEGARPATRAPRVSDEQVATWLAEGGARVAVRIGGWELLAVDPVTGVDPQPHVETAARALVQLYAASFLYDATHPERAAGGARYGQVLWERYQTGLDELSGYVAAELARQRPVGPVDPGTGEPVLPVLRGAGGDVSAPPPLFTRLTGF